MPTHPTPVRRAARPAALLLGVLLLLLAGPTARAREPRLETGKVLELTTKRHGRAWSLYVPSKYTPRRSWPLVISSHDRGGSGKGEMRAWQGLANTHGFIVACPDMVTATNHRPGTSNLPPSQEDDEVLLEIHATVAKHFRVNPRAVMITGFSGGGNPSYHTGLRHPDLFTHICTRGGNFAPQQIPSDDAVIAAGAKRLQIYIVFGDQDHVLIVGEPDGTGQAFTARDALAKHGYEHVTFERVPGMKHQSRPDKAADWLSAWLEENKKALKAADKADGLLEKAAEALEKEKTRDAVKHALAARELERKHELDERSAPWVERLEAAGRAALEAARAQHAAGETRDAGKALDAIQRDYKGLPVAEEAGELERTWKAAAK